MMFTEPQAARGDQGRDRDTPQNHTRWDQELPCLGHLLLSVAGFKMQAPESKFLTTNDQSTSVPRHHSGAGPGFHNGL